MSSTLASLPTSGPLPGMPSRERWTKRLVRIAVSARANRIICLVLGIWMINVFDLIFTIISHQQGLLFEQNPLARHLLQDGVVSIILFKLGLVMIGSYPLLRFRKTRIAELAAYLVFVAYALLAIRWSICYELYAYIVPHGTDLANLDSIRTIAH